MVVIKPGTALMIAGLFWTLFSPLYIEEMFYRAILKCHIVIYITLYMSLVEHKKLKVKRRRSSVSSNGVIAANEEHKTKRKKLKVRKCTEAENISINHDIQQNNNGKDNKIDFENLVIEGGGVLGIAYLGALRELFNDKSIEKASSFAGSSIGSIVATVLAIRCNYQRLEEIVLNLNLEEFKDRSWLIPDIARFLNKFGFYKGDKLLKFVQDFLRENTGNPDITFKELYDKYKTKLVITGTNLSKGNVTYFCVENTPDMPVALANRISCSVPYLFQSLMYNNDYYIDGGILNNYPINIFDINKCINKKTLGLKLISESDINIEKGFMTPITNIKTFTLNLMTSVQGQALKIHVKQDDWKRTVCIYTGNLSFLNFNLTNEEKLFLVNEGSKAIKNYKIENA